MKRTSNGLKRGSAECTDMVTQSSLGTEETKSWIYEVPGESYWEADGSDSDITFHYVKPKGEWGLAVRSLRLKAVQRKKAASHESGHGASRVSGTACSLKGQSSKNRAGTSPAKSLHMKNRGMGHCTGDRTQLEQAKFIGYCVYDQSPPVKLKAGQIWLQERMFESGRDVMCPLSLC